MCVLTVGSYETHYSINGCYRLLDLPRELSSKTRLFSQTRPRSHGERHPAENPPGSSVRQNDRRGRRSIHCTPHHRRKGLPMMPMNLAEAKARLKIPDLWRILDFPGDCSKNPCHSPFYERTTEARTGLLQSSPTNCAPP